MSKFNASEILVGVKSLVDLIEGEFDIDGAGEHKAGLLRDLAEGVFGEETVAKHWPRIESMVARIVKIRNLAKAFQTARKAVRGK